MDTSGFQFCGGTKRSDVPIEIKPLASAMEQPGEKPAAEAEDCGEARDLPQAAEKCFEDRIRLLLRCPCPASRPCSGGASFKFRLTGCLFWLRA